MIYVLDACALIAYVRGELGKLIVEDILFASENIVFMHAINLCEAYYDFVRTDGAAIAGRVVSDSELAGIDVRDDLDTVLWMTAGDIKAEYKRISLADCFAIALAKRLDATLLTSDHREFDKLVGQGLCKIQFIR